MSKNTFWRRAQDAAHLPIFDRAETMYRSFSAAGRAFFWACAVGIIVSSAGLLLILNNELQVTVPLHGGSLTEGVIGTPRFVNPVLAVTDADRDLVALVYSGLLRATPEGTFTPDLASDYSVSDDGKIYTVHLRTDTTFQDGTAVTADDVLFTIQKIQTPSLKSPLYANWNGVVTEKQDDHTITFTLKSAYAPFIENLTVGVLPMKRWQDVPNDEFSYSELNTSPIGSGPFKIQSITRTTGGIPDAYTLTPFANYTLGEPYLDKLTLNFFTNEDAVVAALKNGTVDSAGGLSPQQVASVTSGEILRAPLGRVFGVFYNQNQSSLLHNQTVREALNGAIDTQDLIQKTLLGYGEQLSGPAPLGNTTAHDDSVSTEDRIANARAKLAKAGYTEGADGFFVTTSGTGKNKTTTPLSFSLTTSDAPELRTAARYLADIWSRVGVHVDVKVYNQSDLVQNAIRPRQYDALLFGEHVGRENDLYAFWHSSQRNDPGLNIALYANTKTDQMLEQLRTTSDKTKRAELYTEASELINKDSPALFLYTPDFVYIVPNDLQGIRLGFMETASDRFLTAPFWYKETDHVWSIFSRITHE